MRWSSLKKVLLVASCIILPSTSLKLPASAHNHGLIIAQRITNSTPTNSDEIVSLQEALENLIARVESILIASKAKNPDKNQTATEQAIAQSKSKLIDFKQLVAQRDYKQAREVWLQARRLLWDNYPTDARYNQSEIRAIWLDRGTLVNARTEQDLATIFDRLAQSGINTVFLETVNASYPIYPSHIAPEQNPLTRGWDRLAVATKLAHQRNMELHAWVWIFAAANQGHNKILNLPKTYLGPVLSRHRDWANLSRSGDFFDHSSHNKKAFFDPANPQAQKYLLDLLEEIATNYDVDGIQLDYIRYPFQSRSVNGSFGYGPSSRWQFKNKTGVDPLKLTPKSPLWNSWLNFRIGLVDSFVEKASTRLKEKRPDLVVSAAVFPYERSERLWKIQQNWELWGSSNWVDMLTVMTYAMDTDSLGEKTQPLLGNISAGSALIIPGLRIHKVPDPVMLDQFQLMRNMPSLGYVLFAAEGFNSNTNLQEILNRTQGSALENKAEPIPYRHPFKSAYWRYQSLQSEWNLLITQNLIKISPEDLKAWQKQSQEISSLLESLAKVPTNEKVKKAQDQLVDFNSNFMLWLEHQKSISSYQIAAWQSRMASIGRLISYGERTVLAENRLKLGSNK